MQGRLPRWRQGSSCHSARAKHIPAHTDTGRRALLQIQIAEPSRHSLQQRVVVRQPTYTPLRWELEHRQQVIGALLQVGGGEALGGKSCQAGQQGDDRTPDQPLLALSEAQHCLDYLPVPCQHDLTCAHKRNNDSNNNFC